MCGIAGMAGSKDAELLGEMLRISVHRGPDDSGIFVCGSRTRDSVAMGNNRLKILDLSSAGHQPMGSPEGDVWVVYNGELFNYLELRDELAVDGCVFRSHTDTEVLPLLWLKYGEEMVNRLNGMFAFAIWDKRQEKLFMARDRVGIKPLYYAVRGQRLYFASEIKSLLLAPDVEARLNAGVMREYLSLLYVPNPGTMFLGIEKLQPGCALTWHDGQTGIRRYWDSSQPVERRKESEEDLIHECREVLRDAVRRQLMSDVPVGFFLSGGLDSSTLLACAAEVHTGPLRCYTISFRQKDARLEQSGDDFYYARRVAAHFGAECQEIRVDWNVTEWLGKIIWHLDDAVADHAAIATWLICREARASSTVLLSGQGGDELFAGYRVHLVGEYPKWPGLLPGELRRKLLIAPIEALGRWAARCPRLSPGLILAFCRYSARALRLAGLSPAEQFAGMRSYMDEAALAGLLTAETYAASRPHSEALLQHFRDAASLDFVDQMLYVDQQTFLPDLNLTYADKLSMAASIETRVPLLDNKVIDFMRSIPPSLKLHGRSQKYILKKAMADILPREVITRRKAGFGLPVRSWLRSELREMVGDLLSEKRVRERGLFRPEAVARIVHENQTGIRDHTLSVWSLLTLELWQQTFIDASRLCPAG